MRWIAAPRLPTFYPFRWSVSRVETHYIKQSAQITLEKKHNYLHGCFHLLWQWCFIPFCILPTNIGYISMSFFCVYPHTSLVQVISGKLNTVVLQEQSHQKTQQDDPQDSAVWQDCPEDVGVSPIGSCPLKINWCRQLLCHQGGVYPDHNGKANFHHGILGILHIYSEGTVKINLHFNHKSFLCTFFAFVLSSPRGNRLLWLVVNG